jgi:plastocyanin
LILAVSWLAVAAGHRSAWAQGKGKQAQPQSCAKLQKTVDAQRKLIAQMLLLQRRQLEAMVALFPELKELASGELAGMPELKEALSPGDGASEPASEPTPPAAAMVRPPREAPARVPPPRGGGSPTSRGGARVVEPRAAAAAPAAAPGGVGSVVGRVRVSDGGGPVWVFVEDLRRPGRGKAKVVQRNKAFEPAVSVVRLGTEVDFPNDDPIFHNVFSVSRGNSFDLGNYRQGTSKSVTMTQPGLVNVYCNMHPQMSAEVLVVPNEFYARVGADGFFRLPNVPSGNRRIGVWTPHTAPVVKPVVVSAGDVATVDFELKPGKRQQHRNKHGQSYGSYAE